MPVVTDKKYYIDGIHQQNLEFEKKRRDKKWDNVGLYVGSEGCLTGDTIINTNRCSKGGTHTIKHMFNQYHQTSEQKLACKHWGLNQSTYVRSFNGERIGLQKIKDVVYSGQKAVYQLTLANGKTIKATNTHRIMTKNGWIELGDLKENVDEVMLDTLRPQKGKQISFKMKDVALSTMYHPYSNIRNEVEVHRLTYEAHLNELDFREFLDIIWNDEENARQLKYIDPKIYEIHHKDGNHYNNCIDNLQLMKIEDHKKLHCNNDRAFFHFNQGIPVYSKVKQISYVGIENTYDIICEEPCHNFVANGIVVHNSGKTTKASQDCYYLDEDFGLDNVVFNNKQILWALDSLPQGSSIQFDEFALEGSTGDLGSVQKTIIKKITTIRKKRLSIKLVVSFPWMLRTYFVIRAQSMIRIYSPDNLTRGYFRYYSQPRMRKCYFFGLQTNHKWEYLNKYDFHGKFTKTEGLFYDVNKYEKKKDEAIGEIGKARVSLRELTWRKKCIEGMYELHQYDPKVFTKDNISKMFKFDRSTLSKYFKDLLTPHSAGFGTMGGENLVKNGDLGIKFNNKEP